jgi:hypothetical protein
MQFSSNAVDELLFGVSSVIQSAVIAAAVHYMNRREQTFDAIAAGDFLFSTAMRPFGTSRRRLYAALMSTSSTIA